MEKEERKTFERQNFYEGLIGEQDTSSCSQSLRPNILESTGVSSSSLPWLPIANHSQIFWAFFCSLQPVPSLLVSPYSVPDEEWLIYPASHPHRHSCSASASTNPSAPSVLRALQCLASWSPATFCLVFFSINLYQPGWHPSHSECFELITLIPTSAHLLIVYLPAGSPFPAPSPTKHNLFITLS